MKQLDVLVIQPGQGKKVYQGLSENLTAIETPIWAGMIAQYLILKGYSVDLVDCEAMGFNEKDAASMVSLSNPKLTVIIAHGHQPSASTQTMYYAKLIGEAIQKLGGQKKRVLIAGGHASTLPRETLLNDPYDFVAIGEGPKTIDALLQTGFNINYYPNVPGLGYWDNGEIKINPRAPNIGQDVLSQVMPRPAYELMPMAKYRAHNWHCFGNIEGRQPYASIYTSLGCPYSCNFCCINAPFGGSGFRYWDPEHTIETIDLLVSKYGVKNLKIADEMFVLKEAHFLRLCELIKSRNYGLNIWAYARVDTVKPKYLKSLKEAGVNWLALGIESKSQYVRQGVSKGRFTIDDIKRVVTDIKDAGINVHGNYIFGLPDDTLGSMSETLGMAKDLNCEMANFYSAMAYPGSKLYLETDKKDLPASYLGYSQHSFECQPLPTKTLEAREVLKFRDEAFEDYYISPRYINMICEKFGEDTFNHIAAMTSVKLSRKLLDT